MKKEQTHPSGLTDIQVEESRRRHGSNLLTPPARESLWKLYLEKFQDPVIRILLIAAVLSLVIAFVHRDFTEVIGIFVAIFLATGVSFWFEYDAQKKFDVLNAVNDDTTVNVIRNGVITEVPKKELVVGDVVLLETGEEIPADGMLMEAVQLQVNESSLTGEPSISKTTNEALFKKEATYPSNMLLRGTTVIEGHGVMEVTAVGDTTEFGKVAKASTAKSDEKTPLTIQLDRLAKIIGVVGFSLAALMFLVLFSKNIFLGENDYQLGEIGLLLSVMFAVMLMLAKVWLPIVHDAREIFSSGKPVPPSRLDRWSWWVWIAIGLGVFLVLAGIGWLLGVDPLSADSWISLETTQDILRYFMLAVTLIVVAVPEGLPMSVTLSLALNMRRMLKSNNLVRKMHASETMGAINIICTDKTGTLTQNQMRVYEPVFPSLNGKLDDSDPARLIAEGIAVNSTAHLSKDEEGKNKVIGNPTEGALLLWLADNGYDYGPVREEIPVVDQLTFSTERKYMATLVDSPARAGQRIVYLKGAPEIVFGQCSTILSSDGEQPAESYSEAIKKRLVGYQNQAMRTLGFAYKIVDTGADSAEAEVQQAGFVFLGIVAISDPVRPDVPQAVSECLDAGIAVKIVTGDTPGTAREIARQIGLWDDATDSRQHEITGAEFEALSDEEALGRVCDLKIMSRARPTDKQRLVQLLQKQGGVVAVTGDGTNDAPALNFAQVGLSMGTGTSVAKEASDITLLDDSFKSIASAVMWGRSLYKNIQRFLLFQLTINVIAIFIVFIGAFFDREPLTITQMLWVNIIMDTFAAAALASLPPSHRVMKDKPRRQNDFIITKPMALNIFFVGLAMVAALMGLLWYFEGTDKYPENYALSMFFTIFVMVQFWNMFNAKAYGSGNRSAFKGMKDSIGFLIVALLILVGQVLIVTFGGKMFRTVPLELRDWLIIIGGTSVVLWLGELVRLWNRIRHPKE